MPPQKPGATQAKIQALLKTHKKRSIFHLHCSIVFDQALQMMHNNTSELQTFCNHANLSTVSLNSEEKLYITV